jgi:DNA repair exonuclease SbcCD nuclease subunit
MTTVLCIGDPHIKTNNMLDSEIMIEKLVALCKERRPDFIVCMGDVLDRHSNIHVSCLMMAEKMVEQLSQIAPFFLLIGNHDRPNNSNFLTNEHPFNAMKKWPNVHIVDTTTSYTFNDKKFLFVPYVPPGRLNEAIKISIGEEDIKNYACVFMHQEIFGAKMGAIVSEIGDKWSLENPLAISGHIHDYDLLQPNMVYIGTAVQQTYSESVHKTVSLFTFSSSEKNNSWTQERIDLGMKKKVTVYITPEEIYNYFPPEDKFVKLVVRGDEASIKTIAKVHKIQELKKMGVKVVFKTVHSEVEERKTFTQKVSYLERLQSEIHKDPFSLFWYKKIFLQS